MRNGEGVLRMEEKDKALYVEEFNDWLKESDTRLRSLSNDIEYSKKNIALQHESIYLTSKQYKVQVERMNLAIKEHNEWARDNGVEEINYIENKYDSEEQS